jgi:hypothetical protein
MTTFFWWKLCSAQSGACSRCATAHRFWSWLPRFTACRREQIPAENAVISPSMEREQKGVFPVCSDLGLFAPLSGALMWVMALVVPGPCC